MSLPVQKRLDIARTRELLQQFEFHRLFIEELGWSQPAKRVPWTLPVGEVTFTLSEIAQLGATVLEVRSPDGTIPDARTRRQVLDEVAKRHHENLLIFVDGERQQSLWTWGKRDGAKVYPRDHYYSRDQPGDLHLSKLAGLVVDLTDFGPGGEVSVATAALRLRQALDVEKVTKKFYGAYKEQHDAFLELISGIADERDRRWYASVLLNRLMFIYFLQKKGFLDGGDTFYLRTKLEMCRAQGENHYFERFLKALFFEGFAKPEAERSAEARALLGSVRYLNGGLFLRHRIERDYPEIAIPDQAFENLLALFERYSWHLNDAPGGQDDEISPDVLGYIFEKYINQKAFGAYYTRPEITEYLCEQTLYRLVLDRVNEPEVPDLSPPRRFESIDELFVKLDARLCNRLLQEVLPSLKILDPACGSGAFLVAALKTLINVYSAVLGRIAFLKDANLRQWHQRAQREHRSIGYFIKKQIITDNLFGVDLMEEATEIARLRLFLALVSSATAVDELEPLPNIDFNILAGNSLVGLLAVDSQEFDRRSRMPLLQKSYPELLKEKNRLVDLFRHASTYSEELRDLRDEIDRHKAEAKETLDDILLGEFSAQKIKFEQATWDERKGQDGKPAKRPVTLADVQRLEPFHWGYEFDQVLARGGFDAILTNPPWEAWKPQAKEFFAEHSGLVTKNKMTIKDFEKEQAKLLQNPEIRAAWLEYQSRFPHVSQFFRTAPQFKNQIAVVNGKKAGTDINLYKLFLEQCFNLLREGGRCGILVPTGIYTDLGTKQLRGMLFTQTQIGTLFGLSNEKFLFEGVHHSFRICLLNFEKGGVTNEFPAAFRINPREAIPAERLESFLHNSGEHITLSIELVRQFSPEALSVMEFRSSADIAIAEKMLCFPLLGESLEGTWNLVLTNEFHMTNDSALFRSSPGPEMIPLFTGKMFNQFELTEAHSGYWISEEAGRKALKNEQYRSYRWVHRRIARNSDTRTMISTIAPKMVFTEVNSTTMDLERSRMSPPVAVFWCGVANSFVFDWFLRQKVSSTLNMFYVYQVPAPRLRPGDSSFQPVAQRAAALICTNLQYADLWQEVMGTPWTPESGATDPAERARLRAELDGLVAHLYGLTEDEFEHVLSSFPNVPEATKAAALAAYRDLAPKTADPVLAPLLLAGEGPQLEYKSSLRWDVKEQRKNPDLERAILKTVAGFLNSPQGGTLLLGVADDGTPLGLEPDYQTLAKKNRDGFELLLTDLLLGTFGKDLAPYFTAHFHQLQEKNLCRLEITPSPRAVFLKEGNDEVLYLRAGNSTRKLSSREAMEFGWGRWGRK